MTNQEAIEDIEKNILPVVGGKSLRMAISALQAQEAKIQLSAEGTTSKVKKTCITCKHYPPESKLPCIDCDMRNPADRWEPQELSKNSTELDKENGDLQPTCNQLATDTISRQAAIDTEGLEEEIRCEMCRNQMKTNRGCDGNCKYDEKLYEKITQILDKRITPLLSAQPESNWIPVSERLPEYGVAVLTYDGHCFCVEKRIPTIRDDEGEPITGDWWVSDDYDEYDCDYYPNLRDGACIAWMPLPEPYRAERRTDEGD